MKGNLDLCFCGHLRNCGHPAELRAPCESLRATSRCLPVAKLTSCEPMPFLFATMFAIAAIPIDSISDLRGNLTAFVNSSQSLVVQLPAEAVFHIAGQPLVVQGFELQIVQRLGLRLRQHTAQPALNEAARVGAH